MKWWVPWAAAFVVWNLTFDYQLRRAGEAFVEEQVARWRQQQTPHLIRDAFRPQVRRAALVSSGVAGLALAGLLQIRSRARGR